MPRPRPARLPRTHSAASSSRSAWASPARLPAGECFKFASISLASWTNRQRPVERPRTARPTPGPRTPCTHTLDHGATGTRSYNIYCSAHHILVLVLVAGPPEKAGKTMNLCRDATKSKTRRKGHVDGGVSASRVTPSTYVLIISVCRRLHGTSRRRPLTFVPRERVCARQRQTAG
jgi:hypothetical protein